MIARSFRIFKEWMLVTALMLPASILFVFGPDLVLAMLRMMPR